MTLPDPELRYDDETGEYVMGEIDWTEFHEVLAGRGPLNTMRRQHRRDAHEEGAWVREAAAAYAAKKSAARTETAAA